MKRLLALPALIVAMLMLLQATSFGPSPASAAGPTLNGGGSSFAKLEIDQWRAEVARQPFDLRVNYVAQGSSFGRQQYIGGTLDFAASDIPFLSQELTALQSKGDRKNFANVPVSAGGLGFMYNLIDLNGKRVTDLKLTRRAVCRMFSEPNMRWNDPEIQGANAGLRLPTDLVRPIVRQDGSGTSYVFSEFCLTVAPDVWSRFITLLAADTSLDPAFKAGQATSNWPQGWGVVGAGLAADGVAAIVSDPVGGKNSITYNEAGFAKVRGFPNASVQNASGQFTQPTEEAVSVALTYAVANSDGTFRLNFTGGDPKAYFPSTYSYVIAQTTGFDPAKGQVLAKFLCYAVTKGQRIDLTQKLGYARLSQPLVDLARSAIGRIPGAPPWDQCKVDSAPPPTVPPTAAPTTTIAGQTPATTVPGGTPTQTSIVTDPITGSTIINTVPVDGGTGGTVTPTVCTDPATGLEADPNTCGGTGNGGGTGSGGNGDGGITAPVVPNPIIDETTSGPSMNKIVWWLLQGAAVCALGVALAGVRRKAS
jgi:phosphate transport system substrate-binding protein